LFGIATLLEEKVLCRTLKGSIGATYLEPLKGSIQKGTFWVPSFVLSFMDYLFHIIDKHQDPKMYL